MLALRTARHLLQLLSQPALPKVPGQRARPLARSAPQGPSAHPLCPRGLHAAPSVSSAGLAEQGRDLWSVVPRQRRDSAPGRWQPQTSGGGDRILQRAAHLESTIAAPSPCPLRRPGRRPECRPPTLDLRTVRLLSARQSPQPCLPRQVRGGPPPTSRRRQAGISRCAGASSDASGVRRLASSVVPLRLGGLFQAPFWRSRARTTLSGLLHPSGGDFQSPVGFAGRGPRHLPLARLGPQEQKAADEPGGRGISAPLSSARAASRICAHPAFRLLCPPAPRRPAAALPPVTRRGREHDAIG